MFLVMVLLTTRDALFRRTPRVSDRRRQRAQAVPDGVHKSDGVKTAALGGGSLDSIVGRSGYLHNSIKPPR